MASTYAHLEDGYEKILRYCSTEFRQIGRDSQLEVNTAMKQAVFRLRKRPELLTFVVLLYIHPICTVLTISHLAKL